MRSRHAQASVFLLKYLRSCKVGVTRQNDSSIGKKCELGLTAAYWSMLQRDHAMLYALRRPSVREKQRLTTGSVSCDRLTVWTLFGESQERGVHAPKGEKLELIRPLSDPLISAMLR